MTRTRRKLIEVALPLDAINAASAHEKQPGIGAHPRGLHLWWARRPLAAARAVIFAQMVDDPSSFPDLFPTEKTHSMLALYHLFGGAAPGELAGIDAVLAEAGVKTLPKVRRVVLVGNKISPGNPVTKPDGTVVRTLWGELAYQLGGAAAFARIAQDDEKATSPGDVLRELFVEYGPCLVLVDEWVAYARQLHDQSDLPAGGFEKWRTRQDRTCDLHLRRVCPAS
jgi:hypothetical protein